MSTDCAMPDFYTEQLVVARKEHTCCETGRTIHKGEPYWRCNGKWDGDIKTYKQCESAYHFARWMNGRDDDGCIGFGDIRYAVEEWPMNEDIHQVWKEIRVGTREFGPEDTV